MNVKPGDLAVCVHPSCYGRIVSVIEWAPLGRDFRLPDGRNHLQLTFPALVIESLGGYFDAPLKLSSGEVTTHKTRFGATTPRWLRPITPPPGSVDADEVAELYDPRELVYVTRERA